MLLAPTPLSFSMLLLLLLLAIKEIKLGDSSMLFYELLDFLLCDSRLEACHIDQVAVTLVNATLLIYYALRLHGEFGSLFLLALEEHLTKL